MTQSSRNINMTNKDLERKARNLKNKAKRKAMRKANQFNMKSKEVSND